jgi:hypothetical protein
MVAVNQVCSSTPPKSTLSRLLRRTVDFRNGSVRDTNRRIRHGRTCFDTGRQRGQLRACARRSKRSTVGGTALATGAPQLAAARGERGHLRLGPDSEVVRPSPTRPLPTMTGRQTEGGNGLVTSGVLATERPRDSESVITTICRAASDLDAQRCRVHLWSSRTRAC